MKTETVRAKLMSLIIVLASAFAVYSGSGARWAAASTSGWWGHGAHHESQVAWHTLVSWESHWHASVSSAAHSNWEGHAAAGTEAPSHAHWHGHHGSADGGQIGRWATFGGQIG